MSKIILASGSPRRKELLEQIGIEFDIITSDVDETTLITQPDEYVKYLSRIKAQAVWDMVKDDDDYRNEDVVVIGADTIVSHKGHILTKPKDTGNAFDILKELAGDCHQVYTGVACICGEKKHVFYEETSVFFYPVSEDEIRCYISDNEIREYISTGEPMDKAGAYGIQGRFAAFIGKIDGDYNNVVGLPVARVYQELKLWLN